MPRSKTTESRNNVHKGVRKLSKKTSKKGSKSKSKKTNYNNSTTEEMLSILNSDNNVYNGYKTQQLNPQLQQYQTNVDPMNVVEAPLTNSNGNMYNINKIGALLGGVAQLNNTQQYVPPIDMSYSPVNNNMSYGIAETSSKMMIAPNMPQMMPQVMPEQMHQNMYHNNNIMGMEQQYQQQMPQMMPEQMQPFNNSLIKNMAALNSIPKFV